jgi:MFS family permease
MFRALGYRNYRLFWSGAFLSNIGTWMQAVAQGFLVYEFTHSAFWLGLDGFVALAPALVLTLAGGVFADLVDRRRLLLYTQAVAGIAALCLAVLIHTHVIHAADNIWTSHVWIILIFSFLTGCCMSLASPSYLALTYDLVGREDLANAVALNSTQFQLSRAVGPFFAGLGLKLFGLAGCFYANGVSFAAVVAALAMVKFSKPTHPPTAKSVRDKRALWNELLDGFRYARSRPRVFALLTLSAVNSFFGAPYLTFLPIFARDIFHLGSTGLALLMGTAGAGAFFGALVLAYLGDFKRKGWSVIGGAFAFGVCLIAFALSKVLILSLVLLFAVGFSIVTSIAVVNTLLQQLVTDQMRGRVMSMFILSFMGTMPFGNLLAGAASHRFGAPHTLAIGGLIIVAYCTIVGTMNDRLRELH